MSKRPGTVEVVTEVGYCPFCSRTRNLRREEHRLGGLVRVILSCETCHRTLSSAMETAATQADAAEEVAAPETASASSEEAAAEAAPSTAKRKTAARAKTSPAPAKSKSAAARRQPSAAKASSRKPSASPKTRKTGREK